MPNSSNSSSTGSEESVSSNGDSSATASGNDESASTATPRQNDVLLGRGRPFQNSPGNQRMLRIVTQYKADYAAKPREFKRAYVETILEKVLDGGARFLRRKDAAASGRSQEWEVIDRTSAADKIWHILRAKDKTPFDRSAKKAKTSHLTKPHSANIEPNAKPRANDLQRGIGDISVLHPSLAMPHPIQEHSLPSFYGTLAEIVKQQACPAPTSTPPHRNLASPPFSIARGSNCVARTSTNDAHHFQDIINSTMQKLSHAAVAVQVAAVAAGGTVPPVQLRLPPEAIQAAYYQASPTGGARAPFPLVSSLSATPSPAQINHESALVWLSQQLMSTHSTQSQRTQYNASGGLDDAAGNTDLVHWLA